MPSSRQPGRRTIDARIRASRLWLNIVASIAMLILAAGAANTLVAVPAPFLFQMSGRTYYVDSLTGSDDNDGTSISTPWKSLAKINTTVFAPGDRILLKSGSSWTGQLWPKGSGTESNPIVVDKYGGDAKPAIHGAGQAVDAVLLQNQEYWEIRNLEVTNSGKVAGVRRGVHVAAENYGDVHHIVLQDLTIHDVNGSDKMKENGGINYTSNGDVKPSRFVDLRIEGNRIERVDRSGIFGWSSHWVRSKWNPSTGVVIRNNFLEDVGGDGIVVVATDGALVENNVVAHANQRSSGYDIGIWAWSADNTTIQFNEVYGTRGERDGEGFDSDWNSRNTVIQYNYSHDNEGGFLLICDDGGQDPKHSAGNVGTIVRYNISQNDRNRGINIAGPVKNSTIYNNTIYIGKGDKVELLLHSNWKGWARGTFLYNNIFYVEGQARFSYAISRKSNGHHETSPGFGKSSDNVFDSNIYYGMAPFSGDEHALVTNPLLQHPGTGGEGRSTLSGYQLQPDSPAIDSGKTVPNMGTTDFFRAPVPSCGGVDRGAAESDDCPNNRTSSAVPLFWQGNVY